MTQRWTAAFTDRRWIVLLAISSALSLTLLATPLANRAWLLLSWGVGIYLAAVLASAVWGRPNKPTAPSEAPAPSETPAALTRAGVPPGSVDLVRSTEEALRRLNNLGALAECALTTHLPLTIDRVRREASSSSQPRAHGLRTVLVRAIDGLKPSDSSGGGEPALHHAILRDEYVLGHSTARIMATYSISESTFHRYRRQAIRAVASDLAAQEEALAAEAG